MFKGFRFFMASISTLTFRTTGRTDDPCPICLEKFEEGASRIGHTQDRTGKIWHECHVACLGQWRNACPSCRLPINSLAFDATEALAKAQPSEQRELAAIFRTNLQLHAERGDVAGIRILAQSAHAHETSVDQLRGAYNQVPVGSRSAALGALSRFPRSEALEVEEALVSACRNGDPRELIQRAENLDIDLFKLRFALFAACVAGNVDAVEAFLHSSLSEKFGADALNMPLSAAVKQGQLAMLRALIQFPNAKLISTDQIQMILNITPTESKQTILEILVQLPNGSALRECP